MKVGSEGFAFALGKEDDTVAYYPNAKYIGKSAEELGLEKTQIKDGFSDYITVGGERYFANCTELADYYLFVAGPEGELMAERGPLSVATGVIALICLLFVFAVLSLEHRAQGDINRLAAADRYHHFCIRIILKALTTFQIMADLLAQFL